MKSSKLVMAIQVPGTAARDESTGTHGDPGAPVSRNRKLRFADMSGLTEVATGATGSHRQQNPPPGTDLRPARMYVGIRPRESNLGSTASVAWEAGNPEPSWRRNVIVVRRPLRRRNDAAVRSPGSL